MKQYLLTEDQILGIMVCAMETGRLGEKGLPAIFSYANLEEWFKNPPPTGKALNATIFKRIKEIEIIHEINQN